MSENTLESMENQLELFIENIRQVRKNQRNKQNENS